MKVSVQMYEDDYVWSHRVVLLDSEEEFYFAVKDSEGVAMLIHYLHGGSFNNLDPDILQKIFGVNIIPEE